jgi:hypothetical protein
LKRGPVVPTGNHGGKPPTLSDLGITKKESSRAQKLAALPDETFQELKQGKITINKAMTEIKEKTHKPIPKGNYDESRKILEVVEQVSLLLDSIIDYRPVKRWETRIVSSVMELEKKVNKIITNFQK